MGTGRAGVPGPLELTRPAASFGGARAGDSNPRGRVPLGRHPFSRSTPSGGARYLALPRDRSTQPDADAEGRLSPAHYLMKSNSSYSAAPEVVGGRPPSSRPSAESRTFAPRGPAGVRGRGSPVEPLEVVGVLVRLSSEAGTFERSSSGH